MKKLKLIPGLILLALCVAVLGIGIYAAAPASNQITGTVTVTAASPEITIEVFKDSFSNTIYGPQTLRRGTEIALGSLEFLTHSGGTLSTAYSVDDVADINLVFKITNHSTSKKLGAFFAPSVVTDRLQDISAGTRENNVLESKYYGTDNIVTATFDGYVPIAASSISYHTVNLHLNYLVNVRQVISLNSSLFFNIEDYSEGISKEAPTSFAGLSFTANGDFPFTASVSGNGATGAIVIPEKIFMGVVVRRVNSIGENAFQDRTGITGITIPNTIKSIESYAFRGCTGLTEIEIPSSVTNIVNGAFYGCSNLATISGMNNVKSCTEPFSSTSWYSAQTNNSLLYLGSVCLKYKGTMPANTSITIPNGIKCIASNAFYTKTTLVSVTIPDTIRSIGGSAFYGCSGLTEISLPNSVSSIGQHAFRGCSGITEITIPNSVTTIDGYTFYGCTGLTEITIPSSVTYIGSNSFDGCTGLTEVIIPSSVTQVYHSAFQGCSNLATISGMENVEYCYANSFDGTAWYNAQTNNSTLCLNGVCLGYKGTMPANTSITIPSGIKLIADNAFYNKATLTSITISNTVKIIGVNSFYGCSGLTAISIPSSVTIIKGGAFRDCTGFTSITIPSSVVSIGGYAFMGCTGLTEVIIPISVTEFSTYMFANCTSLTSITIPSSISNIGAGAFSGCSALVSIINNGSLTSTHTLYKPTGYHWVFGGDTVTTILAGTTGQGTYTRVPD